MPALANRSDQFTGMIIQFLLAGCWCRLSAEKRSLLGWTGHSLICLFTTIGFIFACLNPRSLCPEQSAYGSGNECLLSESRVPAFFVWAPYALRRHKIFCAHLSIESVWYVNYPAASCPYYTGNSTRKRWVKDGAGQISKKFRSQQLEICAYLANMKYSSFNIVPSYCCPPKVSIPRLFESSIPMYPILMDQNFLSLVCK